MTSRLLTAALVGLTLLGRPATLRATTAPTSLETLRTIEMTDQDGHPFTLRQALGRIVVLNFVFTGCGDVCPTQTADLVALQARLPPDLRDRTLFLSISVDPEHDFPAAMRAFAEARDVDFSNWRFLTGTPDAIHRIGDFYGALPPNAPRGVTGHATTVQLFAPDGQSVMRYVGSPLDARRLAEDIATLGTHRHAAR